VCSDGSYNDKQIRLDDVMLGQLYVTWCIVQNAEWSQFNPRVQLVLQAFRDRLMIESGCRIHVMISVDNLVAQSIVRYGRVARVAQLSGSVRIGDHEIAAQRPSAE
jgi:hypothetical protein